MFKLFYLPSSYLFPYLIYLHIKPTSRVTKVNQISPQLRFIHNWLGMYPMSFALNSTHGNLDNTLRAWSGTSGNLVGTQWEQVQYTKIQNQQSQHKELPTSVMINNPNTKDYQPRSWSTTTNIQRITRFLNCDLLKEISSTAPILSKM